nr:MAG TPA: Glycine rich protein family [Caudoviricetes sp.]
MTDSLKLQYGKNFLFLCLLTAYSLLSFQQEKIMRFSS